MRDDHFLPAAGPEYQRINGEIRVLYIWIVIITCCALFWLLAIAVAVQGAKNWQAVNAAHRAEVV